MPRQDYLVPLFEQVLDHPNDFEIFWDWTPERVAKERNKLMKDLLPPE